MVKCFVTGYHGLNVKISFKVAMKSKWTIFLFIIMSLILLFMIHHQSFESHPYSISHSVFCVILIYVVFF